MSDAVFDRAKRVLSDQQIVDLVGLSGTYVTVAMVLATAAETVPPGKQPPFATGQQ